MYDYKFYLRRVIDGDSIEGDIDLGFDTYLRKVIVRLQGIDAPEIRRLSYIDDDELNDRIKAYGKHVKRWLEQELQDKILYIQTEYDDEKDKYGRILGDLYVINDGPPLQSVNEKMVDNSLAVVYNGSSSREELYSVHVRNMNELILKGLYEEQSGDTN